MTSLSRRRRPGPRARPLAPLLASILVAVLAGSATAQEKAPTTRPAPDGASAARRLFARENLVAWCIVPFDSARRGPEDRAAMLERLGFRRFAYDWRPEHIPTFDAEIAALKRRGIKLEAFWVAPGELNRESRLILDTLAKHGVEADLWALLDLGADRVAGDEQRRRVDAASARLKPLAVAARAARCRVALYNHGGWFGEPENQLAILDRLRADGLTNVGVVYNLHHGHDQVGRLAAILAKLGPHLFALNLNGMDPGGDRVGRKILPLGQGSLDLDLMKTIVASGYRGPIGILGHTQDDAEERLRDNLDGLDWLVPQLDGSPAGPRPTPRTFRPAATKGTEADSAGDAARLVAEARAAGDPGRGASVFASSQFGCLACHRVGDRGGTVGPDLSAVGLCTPPEAVAESVLWPRKVVKAGYEAIAVETKDGRSVQGYKVAETPRELTVRDATTGQTVKLPRGEVEAVREVGSLMPEGLAASMSPDQRRDLVRFLIDLGRSRGGDPLLGRDHRPAPFPYVRDPLRPDQHPAWREHVNRNRLYDFYAKQAEYYAKAKSVPPILPPFPGLDGEAFGHWGNQSDKDWVDGRWGEADLGRLMSGVFRGAGVTVPKGVCVRLGDAGDVSACFNPETLCYEAAWRGGFVTVTSKRHGFLDGLALEGTPLPRPEGKAPDRPFIYHGFYRHGDRVVFSYRLGDVEMLDAPWAEGGQFTRVVGPAATHPMAGLTKGGPSRWPQVIETKGTLGTGRPYAIDTIAPPFANPWKAPLYFGDQDFLPDGSALLCTMQGDVWRVDGLDATLGRVRWRRVASGLHQALGLVVTGDQVDVLGRDQITRLHDLDGDGEADYHECLSNAYATSTAGHDFIGGLRRDAAGRYYTASGNQGILRIAADGRTVEVLATGFRNPDGLGLTPEGVVTVPASEGEWTPASMICEIRPGGYYGYGGPKGGKPPDLPLVYLPRGIDNSSGSQVPVTSDRWGPFPGRSVHLSYGAGAYFLLLRDEVRGQAQGAVVQLPGEFRSGSHRGRFSPVDGQLYVSGMGGWGTYTPDDGSFQRVRYTGGPVRLPTGFHVHENGVLVEFPTPVDPALAGSPRSHFAQAWNYRYTAGYGSQELAPGHPGVPGHDPLAVRSATVLGDGRSVFLEIPDLQPVSQLHLHLRVDPADDPVDLFATAHALDAPFTGIPGYRPVAKTIAAHPILSDLALASKAIPNRWKAPIPGARQVVVEAGKNLSFSPTTIRARAGEPIALKFVNPDVVPHNWALVRPGTLASVGELTNRLVADPDAVARHYIPRTDDVLVHTDIAYPQDAFSISFRAPSVPGRYPYLCTFPGHWMVMNGVMVVE